jgi:hypothetical protein
MSTLFAAMGWLVLPLWFGMIFMPRARWTAAALRSPLVLLPIALVYAALVVPDLATILPIVMRPELDKVAPLLGSERGATIGWAHFLAFDAFVGRWVWEDALRRRIPAWVSGPVLFFVLMLGPLGFATHLLVRLRWPEPPRAGA